MVLGVVSSERKRTWKLLWALGFRVALKLLVKVSCRCVFSFFLRPSFCSHFFGKPPGRIHLFGNWKANGCYHRVQGLFAVNGRDSPSQAHRDRQMETAMETQGLWGHI